MHKYLITISSPSAEAPYDLDIFPSGNGGSQVKHRTYGDTQSLKTDMIECLNATEDGFDEVTRLIAKTDSWTTEVSLSDECAARLGWIA